MNKKILVVAAHPDDELIGVGATAAGHAAQGDEVRCVILGEGQTSRFDSREAVSMEVLDSLHHDTLQAAEIIGYTEVSFADFPDNRFDRVDLLDIVKYVEKIKEAYKPDIIYTHHAGDLNIDHQLTFKAVLTATRPVGGCTVKEIYTFPTLSSTEWNFTCEAPFQPNVFVDAEPYMEQKLRAMSCYKSELCDFPHPRSIKGLELQAQSFGSMVGKMYAEAFMLIRSVK